MQLRLVVLSITNIFNIPNCITRRCKMDAILENVGFIITSYLDDNTLSVLSLTTTPEMKENIYGHLKLFSYWHSRTEVLLKKTLQNRTLSLSSWKQTYDIIADSLGTSDPVLYSVEQDNADAVGMLIEAGYSPLNGNDVIIYASRKGYPEIVRALLSDIKVDPQAHDGEALIKASKGGHSEIVRLLLNDSRVDPQAQNSWAIVSGAEIGSYDTLKLLVEDGRAGLSNNIALSIALGISCRSGRTKIVKLLLKDRRADPAYHKNECIMGSSSMGHSKIVKLLIEDGRVNLTADNNAVIINASHGREKGHMEVMKLLLTIGKVDPTARNNEAIQNAVIYGNIEMVKILLSDTRVDPSVNLHKMLAATVRKGEYSIIKLLLTDPRVYQNVPNYVAINKAIDTEDLVTAKLLLSSLLTY